MNPREVRGKYISSRKKRICSILLIMLVILISLVGLYFQTERAEGDVYAASVVRVIDGDTIVVLINGQEERVRMIGIDAPESVSQNEEENTIWGQLASDYTKSVLQPGMRVWLTFDLERRDQYDRMLAYVWTASNTQDLNHLFQKQMLEDGYAVAIYFEPNTKYSTELYAVMDTAIYERNGLWAETDFYELYYQ